MRVLFCGDREWKSAEQVRLIGKVLEKYDPETDIIVNGFARGVDTIASVLAKWMGFVVEDYPANWVLFKKAAGPIRNKEMLDTGIHRVEAFHNDLENSKGTKDMCDIADKAGVPVYVNIEKLSGIV